MNISHFAFSRQAATRTYLGDFALRVQPWQRHFLNISHLAQPPELAFILDFAFSHGLCLFRPLLKGTAPSTPISPGSDISASEHWAQVWTLGPLGPLGSWPLEPWPLGPGHIGPCPPWALGPLGGAQKLPPKFVVYVGLHGTECLHILPYRTSTVPNAL